MFLSVKEQLQGSSILLTGGVGLLGSVALEQILRLTEAKVYLLVRGKRTTSAAERVDKMLCGPLFNLLHETAATGQRNVFNRVTVIDGDLSLPGMGLRPCERELLVAEIDTVIHCAANLTLDAPIQDTLRANYFGTKSLLDLASEMRNLRSFVFTSTYWVNNFKPYNTPVKEEVHYPTLQLAGHTSPVSCAELVELLMTMPPAEADKEVATLMARLNFTSTYAFGKLLAEMMFDDPAVLPGVGKSIVRPSLITGVARAPYPGYFTGFAGCQGYCLGYGIGFFHAQSGIAFSSDNILDLIPVDTTAALVIAAASCAAANGPLANGKARVFHATSAASHPRGIVEHLSLLRDFWVANPPPFCLPFTRYPIITGRHVPTDWGLAVQRNITYAKVWLAATALKLSGKARYARSLLTSFKAFCVQNTIGYARSIVSTVDNALTLRDSIVPEERDDWPCVWQQGSSPDWIDYACMCLTAMRCIGFKLPAEGVTTAVPHTFKVMHGLSDPTLMRQWRQVPRQGADSAADIQSSIESSSSEDLSIIISDDDSGSGSEPLSPTGANSPTPSSSSSEHTGLVKRAAPAESASDVVTDTKAAQHCETEPVRIKS